MRWLAAIALLSLANCSQINRYRTDLSARPPELGPEAAAARNNLAIAFEEKVANTPGAIGCIPKPSDQTKCLVFRTDGSAQEIGQYLSAAFGLTNHLCGEFFAATNAAALHRQNARANVNDVGTLVAGILGLAKAGSVATSAVASLTGFGDSVLRNYDSIYLVTPDLATLKPLVLAEQIEIRKAILAAPPTDFHGARDAALRYAEPCTYLGMKRLLTRSVQLQTVVTTSGLSGPAEAVAAMAAPAAQPAPAPVPGPTPAATPTPALQPQPTPTPTPSPTPVPAAPGPQQDAATVPAARAQVVTLLNAIAAQPDAADGAAAPLPAPLPAMRWGASAARADWTRATLDEVRDSGRALWARGFLPGDIASFCPGYRTRPAADRQAFWAGLLSSMAAHETSGFNPAAEFPERDGTLSIGLLQLSVTDRAIYDCSFLDETTIRHAIPNLRCSVRILARHVVRDGLVARGTNKATARGAARYWGPMRTAKRGDVAGWTARQSYCREA